MDEHLLERLVGWERVGRAALAGIGGGVGAAAWEQRWETMPSFLAPTPRARFFESYNGPDKWETNANGEIRCAPSTKLLNQYTTMTNNGIWTVGPCDDPKMHERISEGGFALLKEKEAPDGWVKRTSMSNGREYLHNPATGVSHWPKTGSSYEKQAMVMAFREDCRARALESKEQLSETQASDATNPFGSGSIVYEPETLGNSSKPTREQLVKFASQLGPNLRSGRSSALGDAAVVSAMQTIHRRVSGGEAKPKGAATARTDISEGTEPTERLQRVSGAMVNILSTARVEKRLARNQRRTDRFNRHMRELQQREKTTSEKMKNAQIISGICGSDTEFIKMPGGSTYRAAAARAGGFGRTEAEEVAAQAAAIERERKEWDAMHPKISLGAQYLGQPSARWQGTRGRQTKQWATIHEKRQEGMYPESRPRESLQNVARQRLSMG